MPKGNYLLFVLSCWDEIWQTRHILNLFQKKEMFVVKTNLLFLKVSEIIRKVLTHLTKYHLKKFLPARYFIRVSFNRSVPDRLKAYSLGWQMIFIRSLGAIPGPIIYGKLIDTTCILWQDK